MSNDAINSIERSLSSNRNELNREKEKKKRAEHDLKIAIKNIQSLEQDIKGDIRALLILKGENNMSKEIVKEAQDKGFGIINIIR
jgi:hypothetical protein